MNACQLIGRVERTPHVRFDTTTGQQVVSLTLRVEDVSREGKTYKTFVPLEAYGVLAEQAERLESEQLIAVQGKLGWKSYEKDGRKQTTVCVLVRQVAVLTEAPEDLAAAGPTGSQRPAGW